MPLLLLLLVLLAAATPSDAFGMPSLSSPRCHNVCCYTSSPSSFTDNDDNEICGEGFARQTGPDGDVCVLDYDALFAKTTATTATTKDDDDDDGYYWAAMESQNAARRKFGLPDLTKSQYIALQAETHATARQHQLDVTAELFGEFDTNQDGVVCVQELKDGLRKILLVKDHLSEEQARQVMDHFDDNGDGVLQPEEFITVDQLRKRLEVVLEYEQQELQQNSPTPHEGGAIANLQQFFEMFADTCQTNLDCERPETCCDFGYRKTCCSSGQTAKRMRLEYATVPVQQGI